MTSPRREKWLFDEMECSKRISHIMGHPDLAMPGEHMREYIQSEIKRNVREFAEKLKYQEFDYDHERFNQRIESKLKDYE